MIVFSGSASRAIFAHATREARTALSGSGKKIYAAAAPSDQLTRRSAEAWMTFRYQPEFCQQDKELPPLEEWHVEHVGDVPPALNNDQKDDKR